LELAKAVHATGVPTVVVLMGGRPMSISWMAENMPAILNIWHPGVECGHATADVLFGDTSPGGKLPVTFPRAVGQVPIHYNHKRTGRPPAPKLYASKYIDLPWTPLFPFGHGLSYTQFEFKNLRLSSERIGLRDQLSVSVDLKNVGSRSGDEVVQLYVHDVLASVTRPVKELKAFERVALGPGEQKTLRLMVPCDRLGFHGRDDKYVVEPGEFKLWVGPNSVEGLEAGFRIVAD
jgi:beta-glucosidase